MNIKRICFMLIITLLISGSITAQNKSMDALQKDYPLLMEKFGKELENQKADYIFAIDVSGTMGNYKDIVVPALQDFFRSLDMDDYVSVIKFGGEATNELSSYGKINPATVANLVSYVPKLYEKPTTQEDRQRYYNYTDLDAMLKYLADDLKQIGRNKLKFVFVITDFIHDPSADRRGKEQWAETAARIKNEQSENQVFGFALQLPGNQSGRDLDKVKQVLTSAMDFEIQTIDNGAALSEWFARKKNEIALDKLTALMKGKNHDLELKAEPTLKLSGAYSFNITWQPNELYESIMLDSVMLNNNDFRFSSSTLPQQVTEKQTQVNAGMISYKSLLQFPFFHNYKDAPSLVVTSNAPYQNELTRLGIPAYKHMISHQTDKTIFSFILPLWLAIAILVAIIIYLIMVFKAFKNNRSAKYRINGTFIARYDGEEITNPIKSQALTNVNFGQGASFMPISHPECNWNVEIYCVRYSPFRLKKPRYRCKLNKGSRFKINGRDYSSHQKPLILKGTTIRLGDFTITWKL